MCKVAGLIFTCFFLSLAAKADDSHSKNLQTFLAAKAKLESEINSFLEKVDKCSPPVFMIAITDGFGKTDNPKSAKSLLSKLEKNVSDHVAGASECLPKDIADYSAGLAEVNKQKSRILTILGARELMMKVKTLSPGSVEDCNAAIAQVNTFDAPDSANIALTNSLTALQAGFPNTGKACGSANTASRSSSEDERIQTAELETTEGSAL